MVQVVPGESGEYDIVYSLPSEGRYRMWIRVHGRDVQDSPFQVTRGTCLYTWLYTCLYTRVYCWNLI